jgi:hypothetical protein
MARGPASSPFATNPPAPDFHFPHPMRGRNILRNMFGLDWRSLALMRIGLAVVILLDLSISARSIRVFYSDAGVMPIALVRQYAPPDFSIHLAGGSVGFEAILFGVEAVFALMLLVGYRTRLATIGSWFMLISRQGRNPLVLFGADMIEHIALFWTLLLPLNRRFSVDAWLGRVKPPEGTRYLSLISFGVVLQFMLIYIVSGLLKSGDTWQVEHTAVYYALSVQIYGRPLGQWLNQFDWLTAWLTVATLYLELYGPLLFILPFGRGWGRLLGFAIFAALQIGFGICMQMGLFWIIMIVFMLMLLPEEFWSLLAEPLGRWLVQRLKLGLPQPRARPAPPPTPELPRWRRRLHFAGRVVGNLAVLAVIVFVLLINYDTLPNVANVIPDNWHWLADDSGLGQRFDMFAPTPQTDDGWYVLRGWTKNDKAVDLLTGASPPSFDIPPSIAKTYGDERWCSYLLDLTYSDYSGYRQYFAEYLAREWDAKHTGNDQLASVEIIFMHELHGPEHTLAGPDPEELWIETF